MSNDVESGSSSGVVRSVFCETALKLVFHDRVTFTRSIREGLAVDDSDLTASGVNEASFMQSS
ncbi:MAG: hypothetical protein AAB288_02815, partial [Acidobacteriota bacterium]